MSSCVKNTQANDSVEGGLLSSSLISRPLSLSLSLQLLKGMSSIPAVTAAKSSILFVEFAEDSCNDNNDELEIR